MSVRCRRGLCALALLMAIMTCPPAEAAAGGFDFALVQEQAAALAQQRFQAPATTSGELARISYDQYQKIRMVPGSVVWGGEAGFFRLQVFPAGFIYQIPVAIDLVDDSGIRPLMILAEDFDWSDVNLETPPPAEVPLAGFRVLFPLHRPDKDDEVLVFLGASYFRLLGREQTFGISARGLAIDTALPEGEEFPFFRHFWIERPQPDDRSVTIYALLDSPSVAGAYRFVLKPGTKTEVEVTASLYLRDDVALLGIAPLTTMFLAGENETPRGGDYRPEVHDSDGLQIATGQGEWIWRPLRNPDRLTTTSFGDRDPKGFGLLQRDRVFDHYQDLGARYEARPDLWVEPLSPWGEGELRLIEIPTDAEFHDNITLLWVPRGAQRAGDRIDVAYRLVASLGRVDR